MSNEGINKVIDLIKKGKYEDALSMMIEIKPLKDCEQNNPHHMYNVYEHILKTVEYVEYGLRSVVSHMTLEIKPTAIPLALDDGFQCSR